MGLFGAQAKFIFNNVTIMKAHEASRTDGAANITFGITLVLCWVVSSLLNPLIVFYYFKQKHSVANTLFSVLAITDFLTNLFCPLVVGVYLLQPGVVQPMRDPGIWNVFQSLFSKTLSNLSFVVTTLLCITRYIQISRPFYIVHSKLLYSYIFLYMVLFLCKHVTISLVLPGRVWVSYIQEVAVLDTHSEHYVQVLTVLGIAPQNLHALAAALVSVLTVVLIVRVSLFSGDPCSADHHSLRCSVAVIAMNIANMVWAALLTFSLVKSVLLGTEGLSSRFEVFYDDRYRIFITYGLMMYLLSALNPLILLVTSSQIRTFLRNNIFRSGDKTGLYISTEIFQARRVTQIVKTVPHHYGNEHLSPENRVTVNISATEETCQGNQKTYSPGLVELESGCSRI